MRERPVELEMDCYDTEGNLGFRSVVGGSMEIIINVINNFNSIPFIAYYVRNRGGAQLFGNWIYVISEEAGEMQIDGNAIMINN